MPPASSWTVRSALICSGQSSGRPGTSGIGVGAGLGSRMLLTVRWNSATFNAPAPERRGGSHDWCCRRLAVAGRGLLKGDGQYPEAGSAHKDASVWTRKGAEVLGLAGSVDPETFRWILEGRAPDRPNFGRRGQDGEFHHRPGRDVTHSARK